MTTHPRTISNPAADTTTYNAADVTTPDNELLTIINNLLDGTDDYVRLIGQTESKTIASGSITVTKNFVVVDTEGAAASDDLANILGYGEGRLLFIRAANSAHVVTLKNAAGGNGQIQTWGGADIFLSDIKWLPLIGTATGWSDASGGGSTASGFRADGRLTLNQAVPVTVSDVTATGTLRYTPYKGNQVTLYDGSQWRNYIFGSGLYSELTIAVPATTNTMYDVFLYLSSGVPALELLAWTNDTTRATGLTRQANGALTKTGDTTRLYIGSMRTTGVSGETEDSKAKRFVWNYYNRVRRMLEKYEATNSWTYTGTSWRSLNNSTGNRVEFVIGWQEDAVDGRIMGTASASTALDMALGLGLDTTSGVTSNVIGESNLSTNRVPLTAAYMGYPAVGYHYMQAMEYASGATVTFYGDNGVTYIQTGFQMSMQG